MDLTDIPHERICLIHQLDVYGDEWSVDISRKQHAGYCPYTIAMEGLKPLVFPDEIYCACQPEFWG